MKIASTGISPEDRFASTDMLRIWDNGLRVANDVLHLMAWSLSLRPTRMVVANIDVWKTSADAETTEPICCRRVY
jgi:hypothetical protein